MSIIPSNTTSLSRNMNQDLSFNESTNATLESSDNDFFSDSIYEEPNNTFTPIRNEKPLEKDSLEMSNKEQLSPPPSPLSEVDSLLANNPDLNYIDDNKSSDGEELDVNNLPETVSILQTDDGKTIYLVGTSHFSKQSHRDVRRVIRTVKPKVVVLELCRSRMCFISMDEKEIMKDATTLDFRKLFDYIKRNGFLQGFIYILLLCASAKVTNDLKLAPGGEFRSAFAEALKIPGCTVILGDRPIDITLKRVIAMLSTWQKIKITYHYFFSNEKFNEEDLERYKQKDMLEQLVEELSIEFPALSKVMLEERDSFLAHSLWSAAKTVKPGSIIVGVVGIGHSAGIRNRWANVSNIDILELVKIPPYKPSKTLFVIKYTFYGVLAYGAYRYVIPNAIKNWSFNLIHQVNKKIFVSSNRFG